MSHFILLLPYFWCSVSSLHYYISNFGADHTDCGSNLNNSCGTLYYTSTLINVTSNTIINIYINGQNESDIVKYSGNGASHHPCLFVPLYFVNSTDSYEETIDINIYFDFDTIESMKDWFPSICNTVTNVNNPYMFEMHFYFVIG
eukprot:197094_1